jgi:Uma2 family endonuclease
MAVADLNFISEEEYLEREEKALEKHEYYCGQIFAKAGGTPEHALILLNAGAELRAMMRDRPCAVYGSELRLRIEATGLNTYADATVICGEIRRTRQRPPAATNPKLIVEVLSKSTRDYDTGEKWRHYQTIDSLTDFLLVWQDRPRVEHYARQAGEMWTYRLIEGIDKRLDIASLGGHLDLSELYHGVNFPANPPLRPNVPDGDAPAAE